MNTQEMLNKIVVFKLNENTFGIPINFISEIIVLQGLSQIPNKPSYVDGITNLRGRIITVINLKKRFGFQSEGEITDEKIILIQGTNIGFRVDFVEEIAVPAENEIIDPDEFQKELDDSHIWKLMRKNSQVTIILDPQEIIRTSHLEHHGETLADKINNGIYTTTP